MHAFERGYDQRYGGGASSPTARIEWVNLRLDAIAPTQVSKVLPQFEPGSADASVAQIAEKPVYNLATESLQATPIYAAERLNPGHEIAGPAVIMSYGTTVPLHQDQHLKVDRYRNFLIQSSTTAPR